MRFSSRGCQRRISGVLDNKMLPYVVLQWLLCQVVPVFRLFWEKIEDFQSNELKKKKKKKKTVLQIYKNNLQD